MQPRHVRLAHEAPEVREHSVDDLLTKPFEPCVVVLDDPKRTEMVLRDCATVWVIHDDIGGVDFGYDMETNELVAIRAYGDRSRRRK